jgi:hypothetical protein
MYVKYTKLPIAYIEDDIVYIFLDLKAVKQISKIVKHLVERNIEFYFSSPEFSNPSADISDYNNKILMHYLFSYADKGAFKEFKRINFDLIKNMVDFCEKNDCHALLKGCYDKVKKTVMVGHHDYYSSSDFYNYPLEIRDEFENLYRDIQINRII